MDDRLKGGMFETAESHWELRGWQLRKFRLQLGKTQKQFAIAAGWGRTYQTKIERCSCAILTAGITREVVEGVFSRFKQENSSHWYKCLKFYQARPGYLVKKIFVEHRRYHINAVKLSDAIHSRDIRRNASLLTGWSMEYIRLLCVGGIKVVNEHAAIKIMGCLVSLQDIEQV